MRVSLGKQLNVAVFFRKGHHYNMTLNVCFAESEFQLLEEAFVLGFPGET